jgi:hypothetical protein
MSYRMPEIQRPASPQHGFCQPMSNYGFRAIAGCFALSNLVLSFGVSAIWLATATEISRFRG